MPRIKLKRVMLNQVEIGKAASWQEAADLLNKFAQDLYGHLNWSPDLDGHEIRSRCRRSLMDSFGITSRGKILTVATCGEDERTMQIYLPANPDWVAARMMDTPKNLETVSGLDVI